MEKYKNNNAERLHEIPPSEAADSATGQYTVTGTITSTAEYFNISFQNSEKNIIEVISSEKVSR